MIYQVAAGYIVESRQQLTTDKFLPEFLLPIQK